MKKYYPIFIVAGILALLPIGVRNNYAVHVLIMVILNAYYAVSWNILGGFTGHFSLGNGAYIALGGYLTAVMYNMFNVSPWIGMIISALIAGGLSILLSYPCFKLRGSYYTLSTMAFLYIINVIIVSNPKIFGLEFGGSKGLNIRWQGGFSRMQFVSKIPYFYIILVMFVIVMFVTTYIKNSKTGFYYAAICTNQEAAASLGVPVLKYKLRAQFTSAFFSALGGGFYAMFFMFLEPTRLLGFAFSTEIMLLAVIGGIGEVWGPVLGAFIMVPVSEYLRGALATKLNGLPSAIYGLVLMLVIYFLPSGLFRPVTSWVKERVKAVFGKKPAEERC